MFNLSCLSVQARSKEDMLDTFVEEIAPCIVCSTCASTLRLLQQAFKQSDIHNRNTRQAGNGSPAALFCQLSDRLDDLLKVGYEIDFP